MLNVLFLLDSFRMGGAERITIAMLPHFDRQQITPSVATITTRRESPLGDQLGDVPRYDIEASRLLDPFAVRRLVHLLNEQRIDVIHAQLQDATIMAVLARSFRKTPILITRHLIDDDAYNWRRRWRNQLEVMAIRHGVDRIVGVSEAASRHYSQRTNIPFERFSTVYNGINFQKFQVNTDKRMLKEQLDLPLDIPIITMVGVMRPGKGQPMLLEAARHIPDALFVLVGDGKPHVRAELEMQAQALGKRVRFLGQRMDIPNILNASDIFVLPSDNEALPTVLLEAGAAGLPVVATRVGGIPEIIDDGKTGILIEKRDTAALITALNALIQNHEQRQKMGQAAIENVRKDFTLEQQVHHLTAIYKKLTIEFA